MRNRIARLITIGLTTIMMMAGAVAGLGSDMIVSEAAASGTIIPKRSAPNSEYPGAYVNDPEYPAGLKTDPASDHFTFMIVQLRQRNVNGSIVNSSYLVISTERDGETGSIFVNEVDASGNMKFAGSLAKNSGKNGKYEVVPTGNGRYDWKFTDESISSNGALSVLGGRFMVKNIDGMAQVVGDADASNLASWNAKLYNNYYYYNFSDNVSYRLFTLSGSSVNNANNAVSTLQDQIPVKASQKTDYIGRETVLDENGNFKEIREVPLDSYTQYGLDNMNYHIPDAKDFSKDGWTLVEMASPVSGRIKNVAYDKVVGKDNYARLQKGYLANAVVTDPSGKATFYLYRDVTLRGTDGLLHDDPNAKHVTYAGDRYVLIKTWPDLALGQTVGKWTDPAYNTSHNISNPFKDLPIDVAYYYERTVREEPKTYDYPSVGKTVTLTKPLVVQNIAHNFIPSVPDMDFTYRIAYERNTNGSVAEMNDAGTQYKNDDIFTTYMPVASAVDYNGTIFEIWRGPIGGIKLKNESGDSIDGTNNHDELHVKFRHDDTDGTKDTVTKKIYVEISGGENDKASVFKRPGVYRYPIEEVTMVEVDYSEKDKIAANVTGNDMKGNDLYDVGADVDGDIALVESKQLRYLDVYVEWNESEDGFVVKDAVLHDMGAVLKASELNDEDLAYSTQGENGNYLSNIPSNVETAPSKKEGFSASTYTTYDLIIGKEVMGKGLTNYDIKEREYMFKVTINGPAYMDIGVYETTQYDENGKALKEDRRISKAVAENGTLEEKFTIRHGDYIVLSGIPSGATYQVEEINNEMIQDDDTLDIFETYNTNFNDLDDIIENNTSLLARQSDRNVLLMEMQNRYASVERDQNLSAEEKAELLKQMELLKADKSDVKPIEKKAGHDSVNNVFFLNLRYDNVVTGVAMSVAPYALMVAAAVIGVTGFLIVKKRRDADLDEE